MRTPSPWLQQRRPGTAASACDVPAFGAWRCWVRAPRIGPGGRARSVLPACIDIQLDSHIEADIGPVCGRGASCGPGGLITDGPEHILDRQPEVRRDFMYVCASTNLFPEDLGTDATDRRSAEPDIWADAYR